MKSNKTYNYTREDIVSHWNYHPLSDIIMEDIVKPIQESLQSLTYDFNYDYAGCFRVRGYSATDFRILELINRIDTKEDLLVFLIECIYHTYRNDYTDIIDWKSLNFAYSLIPDELQKKCYGFHHAMSKPFNNYVFDEVRFKNLGKGDVHDDTEFMYMIEKIAMDMICTMRTFVPWVKRSCTSIKRIESSLNQTA